MKISNKGILFVVAAIVATTASCALIFSWHWLPSLGAAIAMFAVFFKVLFIIYYKENTRSSIAESEAELVRRRAELEAYANKIKVRYAEMEQKLAENYISLPCNYCGARTDVEFVLANDIFQCSSCNERNAIHTMVTTSRVATPLK